MSKLPPGPPPEPVLAVGVTDVGRVRQHNEDSFFVRTDLGLYAVADGMGGHQAGDVASALVAGAMERFFEDSESPTLAPDYVDPEDDALPHGGARLAASIRHANDAVLAGAKGHSERRGMGATVVALHIPPALRAPNAAPDALATAAPRQAFVGHVGDSRCYRVRAGSLEQLTEDHSLVNEARAVDPTLTEEELASLPSNVITRALGLEPDVRVDMQVVEIRDGDMFLLCSDGLTGMVSDLEIAEALKLSDDLLEASELLVALANENGGIDNITALVVAAG